MALDSNNNNLEKVTSGYDSSWINEEFLEPKLRTFYGDENLKVLKVSIEPAAGAGDGYGGILLRLFVTFTTGAKETQKNSYIFKTQVWNELTGRTQKTYNILRKELELYKSVLPRIKQLLVSIGETGDIFPGTICVDDELEILIMEDLKVKNYTMLDRRTGLDRPHLKLFLEKLAKSHAASAVLYEEDKRAYDICPFGMFNRVTNAYHVFFYNFYDSVCEEVESWFGYGHYANKLRALRNDFFENACRVYDNDDGDFRVLTHGDMWTNNVMFKYHPNNYPADAVLFDYQYAYFGSPFIDLILFIYSSTDDNIRIDHNEYIHLYYKHLKWTLVKLGYKGKVPTLFEFRQQYLKKSFLKITSMFIMTPVMTNDCGEMADLEALLVDNDRSELFRKTVMKHPKLVATFKKLLPVFEYEGLLDPLYNNSK